MESKKRKLPARAAARVEAVSKKRTATPERQPSTPPAPPPPVEEPLPTSIVIGKPLPTVDKPQPERLSTSEYQSIAESGVLADSLERSRKKWLSEGVFERYWSKPSKRKGQVIEEPNNPSKESMSKIGTCTITIEPHVFDVVMYTVKDPTPRPPPTQQQAMYRPIIQYGPLNGMLPPQPLPHPAPPTPQAHVAQMPPQPTQQIPPKPQEPMVPAGSPPAAPAHSSTLQNQPVPPQGSQIPPLTSPASSHPPPKPPAPSPQAGPAPPPAKSSDPVIQMLAERAATDQDLKALMRIVADGKATTAELKKFQTHIDELTRLLHTRQAAAQNQSPGPASSHQSPSHPPPNAHTPVARPPPTPPSTMPQHSIQPGPMMNGKMHQMPHPQPQALRSKGPPPSSKPDISAVVFEFVGGSGDRFLFPKYSILEFLPGGQIIASFLIVRKGSSAESKSYDPKLDYYQPMTIRVFTHQTRQLEALARVVAPPDDVRRYMDDIMDNMTRAEYVLLAMRLPRETDQPRQNNDRSNGGTPAIETVDDSHQQQQQDNGVLWTASANGNANGAILGPKQKATALKKPLSEEEQYQAFISTVV